MDVIGIFIFYCLFWIVAGLGMFAMVNTVAKIDLSDLPIIIASAPPTRSSAA